MVFEGGEQLYAVEIERKERENIMYINYLGAPRSPSIADSMEVMSRTVDALIENPNVSRVVFVQQKNYNYPSEQVLLLAEIARLYNFLVKQERVFSAEKLGMFANLPYAKEDVGYLINLLRADPISCYLEILKKIKEMQKHVDGAVTRDVAVVNYLRFLNRLADLMEQTKLIKKVQNDPDSYVIGDRTPYRDIFRPDVMPNFTFTRLVAKLPEDAELVDQYEIGEEEISVTILKKGYDSNHIYHIMPPEYSLTEEQHQLLNLGRNVMVRHEPKAEEFTDPGRVREIFFNIARDLLSELAQNKGINLNYRELNKLAGILVRQTIGFGLLEVLLMDDRLQDIFLNSPVAQSPVFVQHAEHGECETNVYPSYEDADSWAAKLRLQSGRALDEANPILDTDLVFGKTRARIAAIQNPLSPSGVAYALRRHRDSPWTLPLFIKNKMINSFTAGLLSFLIDGNRTFLIAGTRSSGKTSFLGSMMLEILPKVRTLVIEDSVTGDANMVVKENGKFRRVRIGELIDGMIEKKGFMDRDGREKELNSQGIEVFSINTSGKVVLAKPSKFIRHKVKKPIYEIKTFSGKSIKVTEDHSLFGIDERNIINPIKSKEIKEGSFIAIPRVLSMNENLKGINALDYSHKLKKKIFVMGNNIEKFMISNRKNVFEKGYSLNYSKSAIQNWINKKFLPLKVFETLKGNINVRGLYMKSEGSSTIIPTFLQMDKTFLNFIGLWLADGSYDKNSVIISVVEEENREVVRKVARLLGTKAKFHSDGSSLMINSAIFKDFMYKVLDLKGNSYTKKFPEWAYNLSNKQTGWLLKGFFSGDGCASDKEVVFSICSKELIKDISIALLRYGIILRISSDTIRKDKTFNCRIGSVRDLKTFKKEVGFLVDAKRKRLNILTKRISSHDSSDVIPLSLDVKKMLSEILKDKFNKNDYITRGNNVGRNHLKKLLNQVSPMSKDIELLKKIVEADIFWDKVKGVKKISEGGYVYDISVPGCENFICENILAHNTLELPVNSLKKLGYNIQRMKVKGALADTTTEVEASDGIRASLRLGDSALIVGEVRSTEAKALYEAMRVGALANVVAGTIHGASPYGVFDRLVNDLNVPTTSFKATDLVIIANPIRSPDGLHSKKRILQVTEVRKHWNKDPAEEKGFVDLLKYNVEKDELEPTEDLINGNSEVLKDIAGNVRGWAGNWDAIYDNIILRGMVKQEIVNIAEKLNRPELLEAKFNTLANDAFHVISDEVTQEEGLPKSEIVFPKWKEWLLKEVKKF